jgi:hypothetical protein
MSKIKKTTPVNLAEVPIPGDIWQVDTVQCRVKSLFSKNGAMWVTYAAIDQPQIFMYMPMEQFQRTCAPVFVK